VLGWGGYWAWDPVENASFLPWLTMTAFLHSVMIQEKRGMLKRWNVILVGLSFALSIFGTFITRSGVISSVHSFAQSPVGNYFAFFLVAGGLFMAWLTWSRWDLLKTDARLESALSREASFFFNNLLLVGMAFSVLWGTVFPMISELVRGSQVTVGPPFFNQVNIPIGLALLVLTGIGPLIAWRRASPGHLRRQFLVPVGVALATGAVLAAVRLSDVYAGIALACGAFVVATILQEFVRGVGARHRLHGDVPAPHLEVDERAGGAPRGGAPPGCRRVRHEAVRPDRAAADGRAGAGRVRLAGSVTVKVVPSPGALSTVM